MYSFFFIWIHFTHIEGTLDGEELTIRSVKWYVRYLVCVPPDSIPTFLHLDLWSRQVTFKTPSIGLLLGVQLGSVKESSWQEIGGQRRVQWGYLSCAPNLQGHHGWLGTSVAGFSQVASLLLSLRPRGAKGPLLLSVLGLVTTSSVC